MKKRSRGEELANGLAHQLEAAAQDLADGHSGNDNRALKAMAAIRASIDASDEQYEAQISHAAGGALDALGKLLDAESTVVSVTAAHTLQQLTQHSPAVLDRLVVGDHFTMGNPESVSFNPVQSDVEPSIITTLVRLQMEGDPEQQDAAFTTLAALSVYNRSNKLVRLRELVGRLIKGQSQAAPLVEAVLDSMDFKDDIAVVVDQALGSILDTLSHASPNEQRSAVSLLGVILAKRPAIAEFLVAEGALKAVVSLLVSGDAETADAAAATAWGLVKGNARCLRPESAELGVPATTLVPPLIDIINRSEADVPDVEGDVAEDGHGTNESDNAEAAVAFLKALARADPAVVKQVKADTAAPPAASNAARPSRCCIM